jgi:uncharacterized protein involved in response to NO
MHAVVMQFQVLPPFIFGFLLTVFPRWLGEEPLARRHYAPVGIGLFGGQLLTLGALWNGSPGLLALGLCTTLGGWTLALLSLLGVLHAAAKADWHARSCAFALCLGWVGLALVLAYLAGGDARLMFAAIKFGTFGLLLPVFFTVNHRMVPFFVGCVYPNHASWRPFWLLGLFWLLVLAHLGLELVHGYAWIWLPDVPLAGWPPSACGAGGRATRPGRCRAAARAAARVRLAARRDGAVCDAEPVVRGHREWAYARAPAHALFIGTSAACWWRWSRA